MTPQQKSKLWFFATGGLIVLAWTLFILPRKTSSSSADADFEGAYPKLTYQKLTADFEKHRRDAAKLPFEEGESLMNSARRPGYAQVPPTTRIRLEDPYDQIEDDSGWSFIIDHKRGVYWAYYYPGYTAAENYRKASAVYGPFPVP